MSENAVVRDVTQEIRKRMQEREAAFTEASAACQRLHQMAVNAADRLGEDAVQDMIHTAGRIKKALRFIERSGGMS